MVHPRDFAHLTLTNSERYTPILLNGKSTLLYQHRTAFDQLLHDFMMKFPHDSQFPLELQRAYVEADEG